MVATMIEMDDGARLRTWTTGSVTPQRLPLVMLHGGPGIGDYLAPVAQIVDDVSLVHRYDQRGAGGSRWEGEHTINRHVRDLASLLDAWGHDRVVLIGHSFGTNMASYFLLAQPERVAGLIQLAGPFLDPWREADRAARRARRSGEQQARLDELGASASRTDRVDELRERLRPGAVVIGGAGDTRPAAALRRLGARLSCEVIIIPNAGHHPWLEQPDQFAAALRAAADRQAPTAG